MEALRSSNGCVIYHVGVAQRPLTWIIAVENFIFQ
jgi:hypothetical protein